MGLISISGKCEFCSEFHPKTTKCEGDDCQCSTENTIAKQGGPVNGCIGIWVKGKTQAKKLLLRFP